MLMSANQLILEFLKAPFLALNFFYYTWINFLVILSVILLVYTDNTTLCY